MRASSMVDEPRYEECWPDIDGLAQRDKVTYENIPPRTFFDIAVIHIMTTSTINRLRELYPEGRFEVRCFRPNIVIERSSSLVAASEGEEGEKNKKEGFIENSRMGKKITIGEDSVVLKINAPCTRCVMITLPQGDLPNDLGILRTVAVYNQVTAGVYASVHRDCDGTIHRGDLVRMEEGGGGGQSQQEQKQQEQIKVIDVFRQKTEPICNYHRCHHKFSIHGHSSRVCKCNHPQNHTTGISIYYHHHKPTTIE